MRFYCIKIAMHKDYYPESMMSDVAGCIVDDHDNGIWAGWALYRPDKVELIGVSL